MNDVEIVCVCANVCALDFEKNVDEMNVDANVAIDDCETNVSAAFFANVSALWEENMREIFASTR